MRKIGLIISLLAFSFSIALAQKGYKIEFKIKGMENQQVILGYHKAESLLPLDTTTADKNGYGVFKGKEKLTKGLYLLYFPINRRTVDFILGDDQTLFIQTDTADLYGKLKITGSLDNEIFQQYSQFLEKLGKKAEAIKNKLEQAQGEKQKEKYRKQLQELDQQRIEYIQKLEKQYPNLFVVKFLKATIEPEPPDSIQDPLQRYLWLKKHYFDNFDLSDPAMLRTPFYQKMVDTYLDKIIVPQPDSLIQAVDYLLAKTRHDKDLYKWMLIHLFNKYARSQLIIRDNIYVHLAEIYIRDADWSDKDFIEKLKTRISRKKNCLIGQKAHNFQLALLPQDTAQLAILRKALETMKQQGIEIEKQKPKFEDRISDLSYLLAQYMSYFTQYIELDTIKAKYIILWFMDPECSHCRRETPQLFEIFTKDLKDKDVKVLDIYLPRNTEDWRRFCDHINKWFKFVEQHKLYAPNWYNGWEPFQRFRFYYDINATPKVVLLDKDKKIIAKDVGPEQLKEIIERLEKQEKEQANKKQ